jgi:hypothetical protein
MVASGRAAEQQRAHDGAVPVPGHQHRRGRPLERPQPVREVRRLEGEHLPAGPVPPARPSTPARSARSTVPGGAWYRRRSAIRSSTRVLEPPAPGRRRRRPHPPGRRAPRPQVVVAPAAEAAVVDPERLQPLDPRLEQPGADPPPPHGRVDQQQLDPPLPVLARLDGDNPDRLPASAATTPVRSRSRPAGSTGQTPRSPRPTAAPARLDRRRGSRSRSKGRTAGHGGCRRPPGGGGCRVGRSGAVMAASQAWMAPRWTAVSISTGSIESTRHPSAKMARISSWVIRRGPSTPGCRSLKHRRKYRPPGGTTARSPSTNSRRSSSSRTWNSPLSSTVSNSPPRAGGPARSRPRTGPSGPARRPSAGPVRWPPRPRRFPVASSPSSPPAGRAPRSRSPRPGPAPGSPRPRPGPAAPAGAARSPTAASLVQEVEVLGPPRLHHLRHPSSRGGSAAPPALAPPARRRLWSSPLARPRWPALTCQH